MIRSLQTLIATDCDILEVMEWCARNCRDNDNVKSIQYVGDEYDNSIVVMLHCDLDRWFVLIEKWEKVFTQDG